MKKLVQDARDIFDWLFRPEAHQANVEQRAARMMDEWEREEAARRARLGRPHHVTPEGSEVWYVDESGHAWSPPWAERYRSKGSDHDA